MGGANLAPLWLKRDALALLAVWCLVAGLSVIIACQPVIPTAVWAPPLALALGAVSSVVPLVLLQLQVLRFHALGRPLDLLVGVGFGMCAIESVFILALAPVGEPTASHLSRTESLTAMAVVTRGLTYLVFGTAVLQSGRVLAPGRRAPTAVLSVSVGLLVLAVGTACAYRFGPTLPDALEAEAAAALSVNLTVPDLLAGQAGWLFAGNAVLAGLLVVVAYGVVLLARDLADAHLRVLGFGLSLLALSQVHALLFPPGPPGYVSTSDMFRVVAYLALLFPLVTRVTDDLAISASAEERLRLSRELHDGLAQQLSVLNLRLVRAIEACPDAVAHAIGSDLQASRKLAQTALLEARQAITALRSGRIAWQEFVDALEAFCDESAQNHGIEIRLRVDGAAGALDTELLFECARMINETISNAVRHGGATRVLIDVLAERPPARLSMRVRDNGRGLHQAAHTAGGGVGLRSLEERLERRGGLLKLGSHSAGGTLVEIEIPLKVSSRRIA